jgi:hypothetical protein
MGNQFSEMPDDMDDEWYEEPDLEIGDLTSALLPPSPHKMTARRRLDRFLEQRRLDWDLRDMLEDDDEESPATQRRRRNRQRRQRAKHKTLVGA